MKKLNALVVDDDDMARMSIIRLCEKSDMFDQIESFDNAEDASQYLFNMKPDVVFLDVEMPGINGIELLRSFNDIGNVIIVSGKTDYAFDAELLGRDGNTIFANQLTNTHGAFKVPTAVGQSNEYLMAANFTLSYGRIPFGIFADLGHSSNTSFMADAGIYARFTDALKIYLPLGYTSDINAEIKARGWKWYNLIRFELSLDELNLLEKSQRIQL